MPESPPHDEFLQLCALATSGQLREEERRKLDDHLLQCPSCREVMEQYEALAHDVLPAMSEEFLADSNKDSWAWSEKRAEADLLARVAGDKASARFRVGRSWLNQPKEEPHYNNDGVDWGVLRYAIAAVVLMSIGVGAYRLGERHGRAEERIQPNVAASPASVEPSVPSVASDSTRGELETRAAKINELGHQLAQQAAVLKQIHTQKAQLESQLKEGSAQTEALTAQRIDLMAQLDAAHTSGARLQQELQTLATKPSLEVQENKDLQEQLRTLRVQLTDQQDTIEQQQELLAHDRDIRELMGARDLYIAEVYDVADQGKTKKAFGRLFYTKGKSLIFYAYDLDQQKGLKNASTFQAWGRRGTNWKQATNLGVFYEDNTAKKRWVLRFDDPQKLAQIDAVFVTVEPDGGSQKPSGKPLLFAYLKIDSNHP